MENVSAIRNVSLIEARLDRAPKNDDQARTTESGSGAVQVPASRLPSFEAAFDVATELDELISRQPDTFVDAHAGLTRERVRELLR